MSLALRRSPTPWRPSLSASTWPTCSWTPPASPHTSASRRRRSWPCLSTAPQSSSLHASRCVSTRILLAAGSRAKFQSGCHQVMLLREKANRWQRSDCKCCPASKKEGSKPPAERNTSCCRRRQQIWQGTRSSTVLGLNDSHTICPCFPLSRQTLVVQQKCYHPCCFYTIFEHYICPHFVSTLSHSGALLLLFPTMLWLSERVTHA